VIPVWSAAIVATAASWHGCAVFKVREEARAPDWGARSLKTQQHAPAGGAGPPKRVRDFRRPATEQLDRVAAWPRGAGRRQVRSTFRKPIRLGRRMMRRTGKPAAPFLELPRKEVIQPHLPVRLPCYDFTPVTSPTFDGSLPEG
jgi:hypothetical protein